MINKETLNLIKSHEGLRLQQYLAPEGQWTVGYGHVILPHEKGLEEITEAKAGALLISDLEIAERAVNRYVEVDLNDNERGALVSFVFNGGSGAFRRSTLLRKLNNENRTGAAEEFTKWVYATVGGKKKKLNGLVRRRHDEKTLFLKPVRKPISQSRTLHGAGAAVLGGTFAAFAPELAGHAGIMLTMAGGGWAAYARIDDRLKGRN